MKSILRHLVSDEVGVSAVLATALDPSICPEAKPCREILWAGLAKLIGIGLSSGGPSAVYFRPTASKGGVDA